MVAATLEDTIQEWVRLSELIVDPSYQRPIFPAWVRKLAMAWDESAAGVIYVSLRPSGALVVLDGQQRVAARLLLAQERGENPTEVYVRVGIWSGLSITEEATLFVKFNRDRKAVTPVEIFKARLAAHEPQATEIEEMLRGFGLAVGARGSHPGSLVGAVQALERVWLAYGRNTTRSAIQIVYGAFGRIDGLPLLAVAAVIDRYGSQINHSRLTERLAATTVPKLKQMVLAISPGTTSGGGMGSSTSLRSIPLAWGIAVVQIYNHGLRNRLPDWTARR